jgi:hypothetical protein
MGQDEESLTRASTMTLSWTGATPPPTLVKTYQ